VVDFRFMEEHCTDFYADWRRDHAGPELSPPLIQTEAPALPSVDPGTPGGADPSGGGLDYFQTWVLR
jgi:hypothetical protein